MKRIGWIGTGKMGSPMASRLLKAGYEVYIFDKLKSNYDELLAHGAKETVSPADMAQKVECIFTMIPNSAILKDIVAGEKGILCTEKSGLIHVDMSTLDPKGSSDVAGLLAKEGIRYLRATVTGSTAYAKAGTLGIMISGEKDLYEIMLPVLKELGNRYTYLGKTEEANYMKIIINMMVGTTMQMLAESLVMGEKVGIDWNILIDLIADSAAAAPIVKFKVEALKARNFTAMAAAAVMEKDMNIALDIAKEYNICLPLTAISRQFYTAMSAQGLGGIDYSGILLVNEKTCGLSTDISAPEFG